MSKMKSFEFAALVKNVLDFKNVYAYGMWGQWITKDIIAEKAKQYPDWYTDEKKKMLTKLIGTNTAGFDCVNLLKAVSWGWTGDRNSLTGGAKYCSNGCPDKSANGMIEICTDVSDDFNNIQVGEYCWLKGHAGLYIGDGLSIECTNRQGELWKPNGGGVQITGCNRKVTGYPLRTWTKHGKLPFLDYTAAQPSPAPSNLKPGQVIHLNSKSDLLSLIDIISNSKIRLLDITDGKAHIEMTADFTIPADHITG